MNKIESIKKENLNEINNVSSANLFGIKTDLEVPQFIKRGDHCPPIDKNYVFDDDTTVAILLGLRINLDSHVSRIDLIGKDSIVLKEGKQVTEFQEGILPWAFQNNVALVFDEYDAGRPDVMFVIQRVLENEGKLTLLDQNKVLTPHPFFRIFATANTVGLGDTSGIYHGTNQINQGQMDRWNIVAKLNYLDEEKEIEIISKKITANTEEKKLIKAMVQMANLTRKGFEQKDISIVMSPRTVIMWAENYKLINNIQKSLAMTFLNKCDESEVDIYKEYFQRAFGEDF